MHAKQRIDRSYGGRVTRLDRIDKGKKARHDGRRALHVDEDIEDRRKAQVHLIGDACALLHVLCGIE